ncbi:acetoin utilization protein AcuC [Blastococcus sp. Marseille-P5729]|uniref:acetoin utilization protein AcuC n=1 Tax=Blastococcus sp. Marseille-P5729 TaxID=2086582 RepID=UPI000D0EE98B|nr:acetoin utilization protein AcuC [Blastococcus sp. Marseille-P5729]
MSDSVAVIWTDEYLKYDHGGDHPMHPVRVELTMKLAESLGVLKAPNISIHEPTAATEEQLLRVHSARYLSAVREAPIQPWGIGHGLGTDDNPIFWGMYESAAMIAGGTTLAAQLVWEGTTQHAVNIGGGMHHAMPGSAAGFCIFNDLSVAIAWLLDHGAQRVAYVDVDVHHGDGVQASFYDDPRVMTVSIHQSPLSLWPHTGFASEVGRDDGTGTSVNLALPPGSSNREWLTAFEATIPNILRQFRPEIIITQCGCDTHHEDPLADLSLTIDGQAAIYGRLHELAHELCGGKWVATGGGGYGLVRAVPRSWTHLIAEASGNPIPTTTPIPQEWRDELAETRLPDFMDPRSGFATAPLLMGEGASVDFDQWAGGDDDTPLDRAIFATRHACYPLLGLDPKDPRD